MNQISTLIFLNLTLPCRPPAMHASPSPCTPFYCSRMCIAHFGGHLSCMHAPLVMHACTLPCTPPATHAPCHACPLGTHAPLQCMPPPLLHYEHHSYLITVLLFQHYFRPSILMFYSTYQRATPLLTTTWDCLLTTATFSLYLAFIEISCV